VGISNRLRDAIERDNNGEDQGMHADDRETCHQCTEWADHAHHPHTNKRITTDEYAQFTQDRGW
jgi:hypothetical protein